MNQDTHHRERPINVAIFQDTADSCWEPSNNDTETVTNGEEYTMTPNPTVSPTLSSNQWNLQPPPCEFQIGDHVYQWRSFVGIPGIFQHHGIVIDVYWENAVSSNCDMKNGTQERQLSTDHIERKDNGTTQSIPQGQWMLTIVDFSNQRVDESNNRRDKKNDQNNINEDQLSSGSSSIYSSESLGPNNLLEKSTTHGGSIRIYNSPAKVTTERRHHHHHQWYKCIYEANWFHRHWNRAGTCTAICSDAPGLVRARAQFLWQHPDYVPSYNAVHSNCECVAVWCKTGSWATVQASSMLSYMTFGQVKSAATMAGAVSAVQVTVPAAGVWGWLGYTTHVSLIATQPYLLPAVAMYGVITAGTPAVWLWKARRYWNAVTERLNGQFWEHAIEHPDVFVECITYWSTQYEPEMKNAIELDSSIISEKEQQSTMKNHLVVDEPRDMVPQTTGKPIEQQESLPIAIRTAGIQTTGQSSIEQL